MSHGWAEEAAGVWWALPLFGMEAGKCGKRQRIEKRLGMSWRRHLNTLELSSSLKSVDLNWILPNWVLILFSVFTFAEYIVTGISPGIWCCTTLNILRNQFPGISAWVPNVSGMFWPESLCVSLSHLLNRNNNLLSSYGVLLKEMNIVKHSYAILTRALEKLTGKLAIVTSKQVLNSMW